MRISRMKGKQMAFMLLHRKQNSFFVQIDQKNLTAEAKYQNL